MGKCRKRWVTFSAIVNILLHIFLLLKGLFSKGELKTIMTTKQMENKLYLRPTVCIEVLSLELTSRLSWWSFVINVCFGYFHIANLMLILSDITDHSLAGKNFICWRQAIEANKKYLLFGWPSWSVIDK